MKILLQLLREFWLPLLLGIVWTIYNFVDRPLAQWTAREAINVFGPTFFFLSWLLAQWYRVKKQQRVEDGITEIQRDVRAIHSPLLPCGLFLTLRFEATDNDLELLFKDEDGYHGFHSDQAMPPPPLGLPPGMTEGRLFRPGGYLDYENGVLSAAGFFNQKHPGYNTIHRTVSHTVSSISAIDQAKKRHSSLFALPRTKVELYFGVKSISEHTKPSLVLVSGPNPPEIAAACALDNSVFVDHVMHLLPEPANQTRSWGTADLKGAHIRVTLSFFFIEPISFLPKGSWPTMHNLQLLLGGCRI
jgi:hypothetical protein